MKLSGLNYENIFEFYLIKFFLKITIYSIKSKKLIEDLKKNQQVLFKFLTSSLLVHLAFKKQFY